MGVEKLVGIVRMRDEASPLGPARGKAVATSTVSAPSMVVVKIGEAQCLVWASTEVSG